MAVLYTARQWTAKATGPDGIPNAALKHIIAAHPDIFADLYNKCILEGNVPQRWKIQRLVLIPKPGKDLDDPSAYRPLCMLDTMGKILEKLICSRLEDELAMMQGISDQQFRFRKQRSTTDAIRAVTDIASRAIQGTRWAGGSKQYCLVCTLDVKKCIQFCKLDSHP